MKKLICGILLLGFIFPPVLAEDGVMAEKVVKETVDFVTRIVEEKALTPEVRREKLLAVLLPKFDFQLMAKLTLGKTYWPKFSETERKEFVDLFVNQMQDAYIGKIELVAQGKVQIDPAQMVTNKAHITSRVVTQNETINLLYKLYQADAAWKVYDFEIEGISVIKSYGAQYSQILQDGSPETLLKRMREKAKDKKE